MLPNFQQRITLKPGSSCCCSAVSGLPFAIGCEIVVSQFVGKNGQF